MTTRTLGGRARFVTPRPHLKSMRLHHQLPIACRFEPHAHIHTHNLHGSLARRLFAGATRVWYCHGAWHTNTPTVLAGPAASVRLPVSVRGCAVCAVVGVLTVLLGSATEGALPRRVHIASRCTPLLVPVGRQWVASERSMWLCMSPTAQP